jgi:hypothetical protein
MAAMVVEGSNLVLFMRPRSIVTPFSMLFELAHVVWPPLRTANCTCLQLWSSTSNLNVWLTSSVDFGCTIHEGDMCALSDQYEMVRRRYRPSSLNRTWANPAFSKASHCNLHRQLPLPRTMKLRPNLHMLLLCQQRPL